MKILQIVKMTENQENIEMMEDSEEEEEQIEVQFQSEKGDSSFSAFSVPKSVTKEKLMLLLKAFQKLEVKKGEEEDEEDLDVPYLFFINGHEIQTSLSECIKYQIVNTEKTVPIVYQPQAVFK